MAIEISGVELGRLMAEAIASRVPNSTTTAQRLNALNYLRGRGNIVEAPGARLAAGQKSIADWNTGLDRLQSIHAMRAVEDRDIALAQREASMAAAPGRGLQLPYNWGTSETGASQAEEAALLAQMAADFAQRAKETEALQAGRMGDTSLSQQMLGMVSPDTTEQGFSATDYLPGGEDALGQNLGDAEPVDTVARNALDWLNNLFKKDEQQPEVGGQEQAQQPQVAGDQGFTSETYVPGGQPALDALQEQEQVQPWVDPGGVTATGLGAEGQIQSEMISEDIQGGITDEEQAQLDAITSQLQSSRPDPNADSTRIQSDISLPVISGQKATTDAAQAGLPTATDQSASNDEIIGALLQQYGSQLSEAGYESQVQKFASGNYTKSDVDALLGQYGNVIDKNMVTQLQQVSNNLASEEVVVTEDSAGFDPNYSAQQGTTSSGSSQFTTQHGFGAKDYNPQVAIGQNESFMDYTKRMHLQNQQSNADKLASIWT